MCGIAGFCNFTGDWARNIERMKQRMLHRGPDAGGTWRSPDGSVVLGHRRLSIVDLSAAGAQPMTSHSGRYVLCYNGEIYDHKVLAARLQAQGVRFRGSSDTEVLLEAIEAYGLKSALQQSKGMFALALYDQQEKTLTLARDRMGEKPLYYGMVNGSFAFASDLGCLAVLDGFCNGVDRKVLDLYFSYGYIPAPYTIYEGIYKLEPGTVLTVRPPYTAWTAERYWDIREVARQGQAQLFPGTRQEAADELERLLKAAIAEQMEADVPVGAFLSSGIDSSAVVALMQAAGRGTVKSFTIGLAGSPLNEAAEARAIAQHLGTQHTELYITPEDAKAAIPGMAAMYGEPFADVSQIPTYLVSKLTRQHVTVSLSGDAGDELFSGYNSYTFVERYWKYSRLMPPALWEPAARLILNTPLRHNHLLWMAAKYLGAPTPEDLYIRGETQDAYAGKLTRQHLPCPYAHSEYPRGFLQQPVCNIMLMNQLMYLPDDILVKVDRAAMAVSLETRIPFLDRDVVRFAWTLPLALQRENGVGKQVLRNVLYRYVPKELVERPKKGFSIPIAQWLREPGLRDWAEDLLDRDTLERQGLLDAGAVRAMWTDFVQHGRWERQIWMVLMFQQWMASRESA